MPRHILLIVALLALLAGGLAPVRPTLAQTPFADPAFQRTWERTDKPVADGRANRSWYWGPTPGASSMEPYRNAPGGQRKVQYFDKTRMEINNPAAPQTSPFYVTNGLLATELMTGRMQVGDADFEPRCAADIPLASDNDDATAPTYATFGTLMNAPKQSQVGGRALATTDKAGTVGLDASKVGVAGGELVYFDSITQRNIPKVFWDFLNAQGPVYQSGQYAEAPLNQPWFFASGLPTTEAYWARVKIGGQALDVLIQGYERRVLTYIPAYVGTPFAVQMGNVGLHYYDWRYKGVGCAGTPPPPPPVPPTTTTSPLPQPPTNTPQPQANACDGIPAPQNGAITPNCGPIGTVFQIQVQGFTPNEGISFWITAPDGQVAGSPQPLNIAGGHQGAVSTRVDSGVLRGMAGAEGIWAVTFQGAQSSHQAIVWFKIIPAGGGNPPPPGPPPPAPTATPPPPSSCTPRYDPNGPDRDCADFATQAEAQCFFIAAGGPARDPHDLDRDGNGVACESLPRR